MIAAVSWVPTASWRRGAANSACGAASLATEAISAARQAGCTGRLIVRIDSAYYSTAVLGGIHRSGACFSVTMPLRRNIRTAIASIPEDAWTPITYPRAIWDENQKRLVSDAEVAEVPHTAFALKKKGHAITARLIARRIRDVNPRASQGQTSCYLTRMASPAPTPGPSQIPGQAAQPVSGRKNTPPPAPKITLRSPAL